MMKRNLRKITLYFSSHITADAVSGIVCVVLLASNHLTNALLCVLRVAYKLTFGTKPS